MEEVRYTISDAAKMVEVESHVLRYWEDELALDIPRNEMGHRYYTQHEIEIFCQIKALKDRGFQLKAIKDVLQIMFADEIDSNIISLDNVRQSYEEKEEERVPEENPVTELAEVKTAAEPAVVKTTATEKMSHFKYIMDGIVAQALHENNLRLEDAITQRVTDSILNEMEVMEQERDRKDEARFRKLDEAIRGRQRGYQEAAATKLPPYTPTKMNKRRFGWFRH
ncbi:MAG: MerR family transcriptional regulator [Clostridia bacterium]|nr:MerR family transcriptional regulator [Clostridia bacterium]NCD01536.1 MerR family transcriptional regulator [Clostridia bacterium]